MIIWRGAGILAFVAIGLGVGIGFLLAEIFGIPDSSNQSVALIGIGFVAMGIVTAIFGHWLNVLRWQQRKDTVLAEQRQRIDALIAQERFHAGPEYPWPSSKEEARAQGDHLLARLEAQLKTQRNQHTLFFIPMQYIGVIMVVGGIVMFLLNIGG